MVGIYSFTNYELQPLDNNHSNPEKLEYFCTYVHNFSLGSYYITTTLLNYIIPIIIFTLTFLVVFYQFNFKKDNKLNEVNFQNQQLKNKKKVYFK